MEATDMKAGRELDAAVATKVMGFKWMCSQHARGLETPQKLLAPPVDYDNWVEAEEHYPKADGALWMVPLYSRHIAEAWQVVEKMQEMNTVIEITGGPRGVQVHIDGHGFDAQAEALRAPHAICIAALKALDGGRG